jgi:L-alanine-DL-glutamate epimerase-like enolase superfamily enzyme
MKIESIDFFYLSMPEVLDIGDGSQDALLVRVQARDYVGWGECEASPLVSIAGLVCPKSHSACKSVQESVLGHPLDSIQDITRIGNLVRANSLDVLQADHTFSGIDIALWDLMGKRMGLPVYKMLGYAKAYPKIPYASQLFGDTPQETLEKAKRVRKQGYWATKFGWGPYGKKTAEIDAEQVHAAREGLGEDGILLVDAGTVWVDDVRAASARIKALEEVKALWLEEPFVSGALKSYKKLAGTSNVVKLAGGEGCHNFYMAQQMIDYAGIGFVQIDTGRAGITTSKQIADYAHANSVSYVNHTFTTHLALSASLQPYVGLKDDTLCEYPVEPKSLAVELTKIKLLPDQNGQIHLPDAPGLGIEPDPEAIRKYLVDTEIKVGGKVLYRTPKIYSS